MSSILICFLNRFDEHKNVWHRRQAHTAEKTIKTTRKTKYNRARKRIAKQGFFGKRRRKGAKRTDSKSKPTESEVYGKKARRRGTVPLNRLGLDSRFSGRATPSL